jgi:predicted aldo/keto reductase-like oxidoreductase
MKRRDFLQGLSAAGLLSMWDPAYVTAKDRLLRGEALADPVPKRPFGRARDQMISVIGFGGILVMDETPDQAANFVSEAVDRGVNYFDVAPTYGNAEERLGPALEPHRDQCFLACKTTKRDAKEAEAELKQSLKLLRTDRFDLYQLHAITTLEDVEQAFAKGGAMETFIKAKQEGVVRYLGFSAHSELAAHAALDRYDFDSVLFPFGFPLWIKEEFGPSVHRRAQEGDKGILALKAMAHQKWPQSISWDQRPWGKAWYQPFDTIDKIALGLRFTSHLPVHAMIPPGHWELFKMAIELAQSGALTPLNEAEKQVIQTIAGASEPIFTKQA